MTSNPRALSVIVVISAVTVLLRAVPFLAMERLSSSEYLQFIGRKMPTGVMVLLVAYTLQEVSLTSYPYGLPDLGSLLLAIVLYWTTRSSLLSIGVSLVVYLVTVNVVV